MKPRLLLVNDDGVFAPGLRTLYDALAPMADVWVVAPAFEQSGVGLSVSLRSPLLLEEALWEGGIAVKKVSGTPADCVRMALQSVLPCAPDLIVSGINKGSNAGRNLLYSGTVGAVIEAAHKGIAGVAFSCQEYERPNYALTPPYIQTIVQHLLENPLPTGTLLNVNFPAQSEIRGIKLASQGRGYIKENFLGGTHPEGAPYFWTGYQEALFEEEETSDIFWLKKGFITAVPIAVHPLTNQAVLKERKATFEQLFLPTLSV